jgi:hypothetical protein
MALRAAANQRVSRELAGGGRGGEHAVGRVCTMDWAINELDNASRGAHTCMAQARDEATRAAGSTSAAPLWRAWLQRRAGPERVREWADRPRWAGDGQARQRPPRHTRAKAVPPLPSGRSSSALVMAAL